MTKPTQTSEARELRDLLAAVLDALTLPYDVDDYQQRLTNRAGWAHTVIKAVVDSDREDVGWNADFLRAKLAAEEADAEAKAVRRSVDRAFPAVAAFLADEREAGK
jgi:phosphoglycerate-specific signal transduction histidine kinase